MVDPYKPAEGTFPRSLTPHIALYTRGEENSTPLSGTPYILATPGECETKGVLLTAVYGDGKDHLFFRIDAEGLSMAHLGRTKKQLTESDLETIGGVDVLFLPIGGADCYDVEEAVKVVNAIEPHIVIPMAFKSDNDPDAKGPEAFVREMGGTVGKPEKKVILKKKDLPQEETTVIVLEKE